MSKILEAALNYQKRGWQPLPIPFRSKNPKLTGWQNFKTVEANLPDHFNGKLQNISVLLGSKSNGLTDIDLDSPDAVRLADLFLSKTDAEFGRATKPRSHRLYNSDFPRTQKFSTPFESDEKKATIVEIRSTGGQTVFPPSIHESGESIEWFADGEPLKIDAKDLRRSVALLASACILLPFWRDSIRHDLSLAISGAFLRNGFTQSETKNFIRALCETSNDEEITDRLKSVQTTDEKLRNKENAFGFPKLSELTNEILVDTLCKWLEIEKPKQSVDNNRQSNTASGNKGNFHSDSISTSLFDGRLIIEILPDGRKQKVTAKAENVILARDVFSLSESDKRTKFVASLKDYFDEKERQEIHRELLQITARLPLVSAQNSKPTETIQTSFKVLNSGRIVEQIRTGFAVYDIADDSYSILESVEDPDGIVYTPIEDELLQKDGGLYLADSLEEYGSEAELDSDIERYVSTYLDLKPLQLKLTAKYIRFTYLFDKTLELSYLNPTGEAGSGKSRFGFTVCIASRRGLVLVNPSAASLFRIVDKYQPTLFIDEANFDAKTDDYTAIIQVFNAGFQRTAKVPRQVSVGDGNFQTQMFDAYCPKIIGSLKQSASQAFNSRCVEIQMEQTTRNDIPLRLSEKLLKDARRIRNKLTLWRLRNISKDFESKLNQAENELRAENLIPRSIQINIPLYALIEDKSLKQDFVRLLKGRDEILNEEKRNSFDGELIQTIHDLLFELNDENQPVWRVSRPLENELCEELRVERITDILNETRNEKLKLNSKYLGKQIRGVGLRTKQILKRSSAYRRKTAVYFDSSRLKTLFQNYSLSVPTDFHQTNSDHQTNSNEVNDLDWSKESDSDKSFQNISDQPKTSDCNDYGDGLKWSDENTHQTVKPQSNGNGELFNKMESKSDVGYIPKADSYDCPNCSAKIPIAKDDCSACGKRAYNF